MNKIDYEKGTMEVEVDGIIQVREFHLGSTGLGSMFGFPPQPTPELKVGEEAVYFIDGSVRIVTTKER